LKSSISSYTPRQHTQQFLFGTKIVNLLH